MQRFLRLIVCLSLVVAASVLVACGGGGNNDDADGGGIQGGQPVAADADVDAVLESTFAGASDVKVDSGRFAVDFDFTSGEQSGEASLTGAYDGTDPTLVDLDVDISSAGQGAAGGLTLTADKGFVGLKLPNEQEVTEYELSPEAFQQLSQSSATAQNEAATKGITDLASLGIDPRNWLTDATIADPDSEVEGVPTVRITGGIDVPKLLGDINPLIEQAGALGALGGQAPSQITDAQIKQLGDAIDEADVTIETGKDDSVLRSLTVTLKGNTDGAPFEGTLSYVVSGLGEAQDIEAPEGARPFSELLPKISGILGAAGGGSGIPALP